MNKPVVLVDMDGVLADFDGATDALLKNHPDGIPIQPRRNFYYHHDYLEQAHVDIIKNFHNSQYFFRNLPPVKGALEGWQKIIDLGYQPVVCSSPLHSNQWCKEEKLEWLVEHLGQAVADKAIINRQKELFDGIALIDDRPVVKNTDQASWQHVVFDAPYNHDISTDLRLKGWSDPKLADILSLCLEQSKTRP